MSQTAHMREEDTGTTTVRLHARLAGSTATLESETLVTLSVFDSSAVYATRGVDFTIPDSLLSITLPAGQTTAFTDLVFTPIDDSLNDDERVNFTATADTHLGTAFTLTPGGEFTILYIFDDENPVSTDDRELRIHITPQLLRESELPENRQVAVTLTVSTDQSDPLGEPVSVDIGADRPRILNRSWGGHDECAVTYAGFPDEVTLPSGVPSPTVQSTGTATIGSPSERDCFFGLFGRPRSTTEISGGASSDFHMLAAAPPEVLGLRVGVTGNTHPDYDIHNVGDTINVFVDFDGQFKIPPGAPRPYLSLRVGEELRTAYCNEPSDLSTNSLLCSYEVATGDVDLDGISISEGALSLESTADPYDTDLAREVHSTIPDTFVNVPFRSDVQFDTRQFSGPLVVVHPARHSVQLRSNLESLQEGAGPTNIVVTATFLGKHPPRGGPLDPHRVRPPDGDRRRLHGQRHADHRRTRGLVDWQHDADLHARWTTA